MRFLIALNREAALGLPRNVSPHPLLFVSTRSLRLRDLKELVRTSTDSALVAKVLSARTAESMKVAAEELLFDELRSGAGILPDRLPMIVWPPWMVVRFAALHGLRCEDRVFELVRSGSLAEFLEAIFLVLHEKGERLEELIPMYRALADGR